MTERNEEHDEETTEALRRGKLRLALDDLIREHGWDDAVWMLRIMAEDEGVDFDAQGKRV